MIRQPNTVQNNKVTDTRNEHIVPQFLLRRFSDGNGKFSVYFKSNQRIINNQNPRNFAARRDYYDFNQEELAKYKIDSKFKKLLEDGLSREENDIAIIVKSLDNNPALIKNDDIKEKLLLFIHLLAYRNDSVRNDLERIGNMTRDYFADCPNEQIKQRIETMYSERSSFESQLYFLTGDKPIKDTVCALQNYDWYVGYASGDSEFIISDNPAMALRMHFPEIVVPLSLKMALIVRDNQCTSPIMGTGQFDELVIDVSVDNVVRYNILQHTYSNRCLFGSNTILKQMAPLFKLNVIPDII